MTIAVPLIYLDKIEESSAPDPQLVWAYPRGVDVPVGCSVFLRLSACAEAAGVRITINGAVAFENLAGPANFYSPWDGPASAFTPHASPGSGVNNEADVLLDHTSDYIGAEHVVVGYEFADVAGRTLAGLFDFTVEDAVAPVFERVIVEDRRRIALRFDKILADATLTLSSVNGFVPTVAEAGVDGTDAYLLLADDLSFASDYQIVFEVHDLAGNLTVGGGVGFGGPPPATFSTEAYPVDVSLRMPRWWMEHDDQGLLRFLCNLISEIMSQAYADSARAPEALDPSTAYDTEIESFLASIGWPFGGLMEKRKAASIALDVYRRKGIRDYLPGLIYTFVGITPQIEEWWDGRFRIGYSKIGRTIPTDPLPTSTDRISGTPPADRWTFRVIFSRTLTTLERRAVVRVLDFAKPAGTTYGIVEPTTDPTRFHVGYSYIGGPDSIS